MEIHRVILHRQKHHQEIQVEIKQLIQLHAQKDEGNYSFGNIMRGARLLEAEAVAESSGN